MIGRNPYTEGRLTANPKYALTIPAPEKERILNEDMGNFTDADLHEFVGEDYKGADAGGVEPKVEEEKTEELQPTDDGQSDAQGEQAEQQQTKLYRRAHEALRKVDDAAGCCGTLPYHRRQGI